MTALLKTTQIQEPSSASVNLTLDASGGVTVAGVTTLTGGIASAGLPLKGSSSGTTTLVAAATASGTVTIAAQTGTLNAAGPAFHAKAAGTQTISLSTSTKILFATEDFDTNNNFASSTFTPTVTGYYQINSGVRAVASTASYVQVEIYKNGVLYTSNRNPNWSGTSADAAIADLVYCNGSTDYIEIYATFSGSGTVTINASSFFSASLTRGA